jgi:hypothetical protein
VAATSSRPFGLGDDALREKDGEAVSADAAHERPRPRRGNDPPTLDHLVPACSPTPADGPELVDVDVQQRVPIGGGCVEPRPTRRSKIGG